MSPTRLPRSWDLIGAAQPARKGEFRVSESDVACGGAPVLFALDDEGNRHLLVPMDDAAPAVVDRRSAGVHLRSFTLDDKGSQRTFLDVACRKRHLNEVFALLVGEMLTELDGDRGQPAKVCRGVLHRWRELLDRDQGQLLTMEALVGLYCELHVLKELLGRDQRSVSFWTGPLGAPFDFISGTLAIEAKAVLAAGWNVVIHGLDQLDVPSGVELWLCVHQLHRTEIDGESVPELVDDVISSGVDRAVLLARLARLDYHFDDRDQYADVRFRRSAARMWRVDADFPRITRTSFAAGVPRAVKTVNYVLDLEEVGGTPLNADEMGDVFDRMTTSVNR